MKIIVILLSVALGLTFRDVAHAAIDCGVAPQIGSIPVSDYFPARITELIHDPERFDKMKIQTVAFVVLGYEHFALYSSAEAYHQGLRECSIPFKFDPGTANIKKQPGILGYMFGPKYVEINGVFEIQPAGHFGQDRFGVHKVTKFRPITNSEP